MVSADLTRLLSRKDWGPAAEETIATTAMPALARPSSNLPLLAERLALKAEACDALLAASGPDTGALVSRAQRLCTRLWMLAEPDGQEGFLRDLAEAYRCGSAAADVLAARFDPAAGNAKEVIDAASHGASVVAGAINRYRGQISYEADPDARDLHGWLRHLTSLHGIYQERYLSLDAQAPLSSIGACLERLRALQNPGRTPQGRRERALDALRYHVRHLVANLDHPFHAATQRERIPVKVCEAGEAGLAASAKPLRQILLPVLDLLPRPSDAPAFYDEVIAYVEEDAQAAIASLGTDQALGASPSPAEDSPVVAEARRLLAGRSLYIVGGVPVPEAVRRAREALGLKEVIWPQTRAHQSPEPLRSAVFDADVAAVVQLIRFSSHCFGDLREACREAGKPFVRITGGYGVQSLAHGILNQASEMLRAA